MPTLNTELTKNYNGKAYSKQLLMRRVYETLLLPTF